MQLLAELTDEDIDERVRDVAFEERQAVRAILQKDDGTIALLYVEAHDYHKLPGGGIEEGEQPMEALRREIIEETGCTAEIGEPVGKVVERKSKQWKDMGEIQTSTCYRATVVETGRPDFTVKEHTQGFKLTWREPDTALQTLASDTPTNYTGRFIVQRDLRFLREALDGSGGI